MFKIIRKTQVMETETIQKNGASPKSQRNKGNIMQRTFLFFVVFCISVSAFTQDIITLKNGEDIQALVQEIGDVDVKYKKFDNPNGPNYTMKKSEIFMIRYANGSKDVFTNSPKRINDDERSNDQSKIKQPSVQRQIETQLEPLSIQEGKIYNSYGVRLSKYEIQNMMRNVPEALDFYNNGNSLKTTGNVFYGIEIGCTVMMIVQLSNSSSYSEDNYSYMYWGLASIASAIPAIICRNVGNSKIKKSVSIYNRGIRQNQKSDISLNFGITQSGGLGLTFNF